MQYYSFRVFIPTTVQQLDTKVYNHVTSLLHVSAFFSQLKGGIRQRKAQNWLIMSWMYNCKVKRQMLKLYKMIKNDGANCM